MANISRYQHLNDEDVVQFSIPETARLICELNYGQQRMLAEIVKIREASPNYGKYSEYREHTQQLRELLQNGWY